MGIVTEICPALERAYVQGEKIGSSGFGSRIGLADLEPLDPKLCVPDDRRAGLVLWIVAVSPLPSLFHVHLDLPHPSSYALDIISAQLYQLVQDHSDPFIHLVHLVSVFVHCFFQHLACPKVSCKGVRLVNVSDCIP